jgi:hypothetical protein
MSDWYQIISAAHQLDHPEAPDSLVLGAPADAVSIAAFEKAIGYCLPEEFKELYLKYDGFGRSGKTEVCWFFLPMSELPRHVAEVREWFQETHPEIARRYVPFVDWGDGDASGYLFSESGVPEQAIFMFEHESYEFEKDQDWRDFLMPVDKSIRDLITS